MKDVNTIRVTFSKRGRAKYISHLDLMRTMTRVLRRAGIPLWYTEGFSKHPYITFAAPLSLGYEGLNETMDFRLEEDMAMEEIVARLNTSMPEGIVVHSAAPAKMKAGQIAYSVWDLSFDASLEERFREVLDSDEIVVQKRTKKKTFKTIDIKPFIFDLAWAKKGERATLTLRLPTGEQAVNPSLLIGAVIGEDLAAVDVCRREVLDATGKIFE